MKRELKYGAVLLGTFVSLSLFLSRVVSSNQAATVFAFISSYMVNIDLQPGPGMLFGIFLKNLLACGLVALASRLAYGLTIYMFILVNSAILGIVFSYGGLSRETLSCLLPHAPIELAAIMISLGIGWRILKSGKTPSRRDIFLFTRTVFPLLLLAAILETYITPAFIAMTVH